MLSGGGKVLAQARRAREEGGWHGPNAPAEPTARESTWSQASTVALSVEPTTRVDSAVTVWTSSAYGGLVSRADAAAAGGSRSTTFMETKWRTSIRPCCVPMGVPLPNAVSNQHSAESVSTNSRSTHAPPAVAPARPRRLRSGPEAQT